MQEGKRQKQVAAVIQQEINDIFVRLGLNMLDGGMVSISSVKITPDLLEARIYISLFQVKDTEAATERLFCLPGIHLGIFFTTCSTSLSNCPPL